MITSQPAKKRNTPYCILHSNFPSADKGKYGNDKMPATDGWEKSR